MNQDSAKRLPLRIRLPFATEEEFIEKYGVNVARGGVFVATRTPKPEGTLLSFEFVLAGGERLMRGEGVVQSASSEDPAGRAGMTVRFTRIDARTKALIDAVVARGERASRPERLQATAQPPSTSPAPPQRTEATRAAQPKAPEPGSSSAEVVLGIDLGTTTCRAAIFLDGAPRLVTIPSERGPTLPSVVAFDEAKDPQLLIGGAAKRFRVDHPGRAIIGFKRLMGRRARSRHVTALAPHFPFRIVADPQGDAGIEMGHRVYSMPELAAGLLRMLKDAAQELLGRPLHRAVIGVPAWYGDHQRAAVIEAGRLAGLEVAAIVNEPSAVALAYGFGRGLARKRVLVYDLGGGTFDASVVEITGDDLEVVSTGGEAFLGGMDFDQKLADALIASLAEGPRDRLLASSVAVQRVRDAAESAKVELSHSETTSVHLPWATTDEAGLPLALAASLDRSALEKPTSDLVERTVEVTGVVLKAAGLTAQQLDELLLVGGQSRAPAVRRRIEVLLGRSARTDVDPQAAVALGAALLGHALVQQERGKRGISLSEVLSAPIAVATRGGGVQRILERNTRLPAEKTLSVRAEADRSLEIAVLQGTASRADENEYLGALQAVSDRPGEFTLRFAVSTDGRLEVTAISPSGRTSALTFATADAPESMAAQIFAEAPLPMTEPEPRGLLTGLRRLFGR